MKKMAKAVVLAVMILGELAAMAQISIPGTGFSFRLNGDDWSFVRNYKLKDGADIYLYCYTREVLIDAEGDTALPFLRIYVNTAYEGDVYELAYDRFEQQPFQSIDEYTSGPGLPKSGGLGYVGAYTNPNDEKDYEFLMTYFQDKKGIVEFRLETSLDTFDDMEFEFRDILSSIK